MRPGIDGNPLWTFTLSDYAWTHDVGFERPLPDGSPMSDYVMVPNGTEVVWSRIFQMDDPGWRKIDGNGCATFGLYGGYATYCNGTMTFHQNSDG